MNILKKIAEFRADAKQNLRMRYFTVFNRVALALGFLLSGFTKIIGERFTTLSVNHPMGNYLEALHHTGYYYTFIGYSQIAAAVLLLIPRTATLGALLYFPIIVNICILSLAVGFEGSMLSSPLMVLSNFYLLCWDYDKLKYIFQPKAATSANGIVSRKFPFRFFALSAAAVVIMSTVIVNSYTIKTRNTLSDCTSDCTDSACLTFCDCIHLQGNTYDDCVSQYKKNKSR